MASIKLEMRYLAKRLLFPLIRPRRFNICCCGLSKTGTHSMAAIFGGFRAEHHPDAAIRLPLAAAYLRNEVGDEQAGMILRRRDRELWLEMESSALAGILIRPMLSTCPDKRFILTIRDVYSWCDSWLDHNINSPPGSESPWRALDRVRLRVDALQPTKYDAPLLECGQFPLGCYFQLWQRHNSIVLDCVPPERLLVVKTHEILAAIPRIADWVGIAEHRLHAERGWVFATRKRNQLLATLDHGYVRDTAQQYCGSLMARFFPHVDGVSRAYAEWKPESADGKPGSV